MRYVGFGALGGALVALVIALFPGDVCAAESVAKFTVKPSGVGQERIEITPTSEVRVRVNGKQPEFQLDDGWGLYSIWAEQMVQVRSGRVMAANFGSRKARVKVRSAWVD